MRSSQPVGASRLYKHCCFEPRGAKGSQACSPCLPRESALTWKRLLFPPASVGSPPGPALRLVAGCPG